MLDIAIVEGVRTPFAKAFGSLAGVSAHELGRIATVALFDRAGVRPDEIDQVVIGNGAPPLEAPNPARVIALMSGIPGPHRPYRAAQLWLRPGGADHGRPDPPAR